MSVCLCYVYQHWKCNCQTVKCESIFFHIQCITHFIRQTRANRVTIRYKILDANFISLSISLSLSLSLELELCSGIRCIYASLCFIRWRECEFVFCAWSTHIFNSISFTYKSAKAFALHFISVFIVDPFYLTLSSLKQKIVFLFFSLFFSIS